MPTMFNVPLEHWPHVQAILSSYNVEEYFTVIFPFNADEGVTFRLHNEIALDLYLELVALTA
jgi:hypothetical protein